mgnify:CR=1 FL=1
MKSYIPRGCGWTQTCGFITVNFSDDPGGLLRQKGKRFGHISYFSNQLSELLLDILSTMSVFEKSMFKLRQIEEIRITQKTNI